VTFVLSAGRLWRLDMINGDDLFYLLKILWQDKNRLDADLA
jgi:hypothetical protein